MKALQKGKVKKRTKENHNIYFELFIMFRRECIADARMVSKTGFAYCEIL